MTKTAIWKANVGFSTLFILTSFGASWAHSADAPASPPQSPEPREERHERSRRREDRRYDDRRDDNRRDDNRRDDDRHSNDRRYDYQFSDDERWILDRGEIGDTAYIVGGIVGTFPGLGIGHAIQGRYSNKGWIFTVGELGSYAIVVAGAVNCLNSSFSSGTCNSAGLIVLGAIGYVGFRVWEIIDVWAGPPEHNRRYRALKERSDPGSVSFYLLPVPGQAVAGLSIRF